MRRDGRGLDHRTLEAIRLMAVERVRDGERPSSVIASLQVQPHDHLSTVGSGIKVGHWPVRAALQASDWSATQSPAIHGSMGWTSGYMDALCGGRLGRAENPHSARFDGRGRIVGQTGTDAAEAAAMRLSA